MHEDDQDTLAAEYVLGTLSAQEREQAEALLSFDPGFEVAVRQWERRLGELNVMVEAVEPPPQVWEKIKTELGPVGSRADTDLLHGPEVGGESLPLAATLGADDLLLPEPEPARSPPASAVVEPVAARSVVSSMPRPEPKRIERGAEVIALASRVKRWRRLALGVGAIAALLALYVAVSQVAPELIPPQLRSPAARMFARSETPARLPQDRLVAVLQQDPTAPAFLLTLDTSHRNLIVRRVSATPESGRSYELWLISSRFPAPRSLGVVGNDEFTQRALAADYDPDTLRKATYAVSLEPAGGSPSGAPTGPVLFTGKAVEALPSAPPPAPKT